MVLECREWGGALPCLPFHVFTNTLPLGSVGPLWVVDRCRARNPTWLTPPRGCSFAGALVFPIVLFSSISLHCSLKKAFLSLLSILWNTVLLITQITYYPPPLPTKALRLVGGSDNRTQSFWMSTLSIWGGKCFFKLRHLNFIRNSKNFDQNLK